MLYNDEYTIIEHITGPPWHCFTTTDSYPKPDPARKHKALYSPSSQEKSTSASHAPKVKQEPHTDTHTCNSGCPATILKNRSNPSRRLSITSSENRLVNTFPGRGGIFTRVDSCSRMSRKASKSEYRRRTMEWRSLNAGMLVLGVQQ